MKIKQNSKIILPLVMGNHNLKDFFKLQAKSSQMLDFFSQIVRNKLSLNFILKSEIKKVRDSPFLITRVIVFIMSTYKLYKIIKRSLRIGLSKDKRGNTQKMGQNLAKRGNWTIWPGG